MPDQHEVDESRRIKLKEAHALRSQFNYEVGNRRIDFKLDVIEPRLKEVVKQITQHGELSTLDVAVIDQPDTGKSDNIEDGSFEEQK